MAATARLRTSLALAVGVAALGLAGPAIAQENVLKIGVLGVMSGPAASWGLVNKYSAEATAQMYNEQGGVEIDGEKYQIQIVSIDDKNDPKLAVSGAERLVHQEGIHYIIGPNVDITRMTVLEDGDVLTAIRLPADWSGARFYFEKVADRNTWDFPLVNIAAAMKVSGAAGSEKVDDIRIAPGAVQCVPRRLTVVEQVVRGQAKTADTASLAGQSAVRGATPLNFNHFKVPLMENLVRRAIRDA